MKYNYKLNDNMVLSADYPIVSLNIEQQIKEKEQIIELKGKLDTYFWWQGIDHPTTDMIKNVILGIKVSGGSYEQAIETIEDYNNKRAEV